MPFISKHELDARERRESGARLKSASDGYLEGYKAGRRHAELSASIRLATSRLDALDLVIDAFGIRDQYPNDTETFSNQAGARRFHNDLKAHKRFNEVHEAFHRIEDARTTAGLDAAMDLLGETGGEGE